MKALAAVDSTHTITLVLPSGASVSAAHNGWRERYRVKAVDGTLVLPSGEWWSAGYWTVCIHNTHNYTVRQKKRNTFPLCACLLILDYRNW